MPIDVDLMLEKVNLCIEVSKRKATTFSFPQDAALTYINPNTMGDILITYTGERLTKWGEKYRKSNGGDKIPFDSVGFFSSWHGDKFSDGGFNSVSITVSTISKTVLDFLIPYLPFWSDEDAESMFTYKPGGWEFEFQSIINNEPILNVNLPPIKETRRYEDYLKSDHWHTMRNVALEYANYSCQICKSEEKLQVHHNTYERLGQEKLSDLIILCRSCHQLFHDHKKIQ